MTEVWFYHLERSSLEVALPALLERSLDRGWRAVVQAGSPERVEALDAALWTFDDASFLPHGTKRDGDGPMHPVYLTDADENPNGAAIRFFVDGAEAGPVLAAAEHVYARAVLLFDGRDDGQVDAARRQWAGLKAAGHPVSYWQQNEDGRWEKRA